MRGAILMLAIVLGMAGCKADAPMADPFSSHPIVPPPATGSCPASAVDPGYAPTLPPQNPALRPALPANNGGQTAPGAASPTYLNMNSTPGGTASGAWNAAGAANSKPLSPNVNSASATRTLGNGTPNAASLSSSGNANPVYGNPGYNGIGMSGVGNPTSPTAPTSTPAAGYPTLGLGTPTLIPPPSTATPGGYPSGATNPPSTTLGPGSTFPSPTSDNRYGPPGGFNNSRGMLTSPTLPTTPIAGTPRPTTTRAASTIARPAAAIPNSMSPNATAADYRSPRPVDDAAQPIRSPSTPYSNVLPNTTTTNIQPYSNRGVPSGVSSPQPGVVSAPVSQPRQMPMPPTSYGSPLAAPPYRATIQNLDLDWQPCDGYADDGE
jgi:hypothetical protein